MTKQFIATICILGLVGMVVGVGVLADGTETVTATVTAELITISLLDGAVDYGILPINDSEDTTPSGLDDTQVVTNNSNVAVDLGVKSSDAVGGTPWNLVVATGSIDEFTHEFAPDGSTWATFNVDNTTYTSLTTNVAVNGTQDLDLRIGTPTSVSDNVLKTITVTVLATAY
ncbi:hypothetical protein KJA15_03970 [Patescibacteria group bacterium]|nr:hypothetical protein [Patescibacteria group bacterium]